MRNSLTNFQGATLSRVALMNLISDRKEAHLNDSNIQLASNVTEIAEIAVADVADVVPPKATNLRSMLEIKQQSEEANTYAIICIHIIIDVRIKKATFQKELSELELSGRFARARQFWIKKKMTSTIVVRLVARLLRS
jgi:hypothetical protein